MNDIVEAKNSQSKKNINKFKSNKDSGFGKLVNYARVLGDLEFTHLTL